MKKTIPLIAVAAVIVLAVIYLASNANQYASAAQIIGSLAGIITVFAVIKFIFKRRIDKSSLYVAIAFVISSFIGTTLTVILFHESPVYLKAIIVGGITLAGVAIALTTLKRRPIQPNR
ncbi:MULTISPECIES: hypothetical protein [unclassified Brenneria]|uniref:hypothetical protein n=1 Tax=unclassified Brenneria TaxID=2634434 RepID=UPI0029C27B7F|nr:MULTISPECIES: hypothetical protein [unclassified Brenneria]MDX5627933.1 hypothetical protein [Brenneria sp. L3-3Z]MDX5694771.1 hypothetical protein [Brenneria sp. L4-2C]